MRNVFRSADPGAFGSTVVVLALAYLATRTIGIPVLDPEREAVDTVGVLTMSIEIAGVAFALWLTQPLGRVARPLHVQEVTR